MLVVVMGFCCENLKDVCGICVLGLYKSWLLC